MASSCQPRGLYKLHYVLLVLSAVSFVYWALMVTTPGLRGFILIYLLLIAVLSALTSLGTAYPPAPPRLGRG